MSNDNHANYNRIIYPNERMYFVYVPFHIELGFDCNFVVTDVEEKKMKIELMKDVVKIKKRTDGYYDPVRRKWV